MQTSPKEVHVVSFQLAHAPIDPNQHETLNVPAATTLANSTDPAVKIHRPLRENSQPLADQDSQRLRLENREVSQEPAACKNAHRVMLRKEKEKTAACRQLEEDNARLQGHATAAEEFGAQIQELEAENAQLQRDVSIQAREITRQEVLITQWRRSSKSSLAGKEVAQHQVREIRALAIQQIDKIAQALRRQRCKCDYIAERRVFPTAQPQTDQEKIVQLESDLIAKEAEMQKLRDALLGHDEKPACGVDQDPEYESDTASDGQTLAFEPSVDEKETNTTTDPCHPDTHDHLEMNDLGSFDFEVENAGPPQTGEAFDDLEEINEAWLNGVKTGDLGLILPTDTELIEFLGASNANGVQENKDIEQQDTGKDNTDATSGKRKRTENLEEKITGTALRDRCDTDEASATAQSVYCKRPLADCFVHVTYL